MDQAANLLHQIPEYIRRICDEMAIINRNPAAVGPGMENRINRCKGKVNGLMRKLNLAIEMMQKLSESEDHEDIGMVEKVDTKAGVPVKYDNNDDIEAVEAVIESVVERVSREVDGARRDDGGEEKAT